MVTIKRMWTSGARGKLAIGCLAWTLFSCGVLTYLGMDPQAMDRLDALVPSGSTPVATRTPRPSRTPGPTRTLSPERAAAEATRQADREAREADRGTERADRAVARETERAAGVTLANYHRLEAGMSYDDVVLILGEDGEEQGASTFGRLTTVRVSWRGEGGGVLSVMFQNGELVSRSQFGLR